MPPSRKARTAAAGAPLEAGPPAVRDGRLEEAISRVPRDAFMTPEMVGIPGDVPPLEIPKGRPLPPTEEIASIVQALRLVPKDRVLHIGTGMGYTAAILSRLASRVYTVERVAPLAALAERRFKALGYDNITVRTADGTLGWSEEAPFDAILLSAIGTQIPRALREQLAIGGSLVMPVGPGRSRKTLLRLTRSGEKEWKEERLGEMRLVERLGDILVELGATGREQVERAALSIRERGARLGEALQSQEHVLEADVYRALAIQRGIPFAGLDAVLPKLDRAVLRAAPRPFLEHHRVLPIARVDGALLTATCDPAASDAELSKIFHPDPVEFCLVTPTDYQRLWRVIDLMEKGRKTETAVAAETGIDLLQPAADWQSAHFVAILDSLLMDAVADRASDIHLERYGARVRVRLRVDGDLRDVERYRLSPRDLIGVVNVIKIRANLDIAERRLPQGGRILMRLGSQAFDLRVQTQPALHGEHVVIRLLPQDAKLLTIEELGFPKEVASQYRRLLDHPSGLVLVVGPTGSGKSTTLYAGLQILARDATRKVISAEDPIEYTLEGIQQTQVHPEIGFQFAHAMRSFVRQDPDVILIGEIRDAETALETIRASQTGHLVLSTLHCNDATDAIQRLYDLQMHPNSIASELLAVISQRLARRVCDGCSAPAEPDPAILAELFPGGAPDGFRCFKGKGCARCGGFGARGRIACIEFLRVGPELRKAISRSAPLQDLREAALGSGLIPMRENALDLVQRGLIPLEELRTLLPEERMAPERASSEHPGPA